MFTRYERSLSGIPHLYVVKFAGLAFEVEGPGDSQRVLKLEASHMMKVVEGGMLTVFLSVSLCSVVPNFCSTRTKAILCTSSCLCNSTPNPYPISSPIAFRSTLSLRRHEFLGSHSSGADVRSFHGPQRRAATLLPQPQHSFLIPIYRALGHLLLYFALFPSIHAYTARLSSFFKFVQSRRRVEHHPMP